ncbi:DUF3995 domain-containing protein [Nocardia sp. NPDC127579]|uniref:DUF3995 domain-containing protein n=1 Tax=Nocardia sp. NPDC127579 TaxID=3345402 RepID=UPI00362FA6B3
MYRRVAGALAATGLAVVGGMHLVWTASPWPWDSGDEFRAAVFGSAETDVPKIGYVLVGLGTFGAAAMVLGQAGALPRIGSDRLRALAMYTLSGVLLVRGSAGYFLNSGASADFRELNTVVYSPLCLVLGGLTLAVQRTYR